MKVENMPFLTKSGGMKRKFEDTKTPRKDKTKDATEQNSQSDLMHTEKVKLKMLEKEIKEKEDILRRLKLVKHYKSRVLD